MLEKKKFIYCADASLGSLHIRNFNSMGGRAFVVTQPQKTFGLGLYEEKELKNRKTRTVKSKEESYHHFFKKNDGIPAVHS